MTFFLRLIGISAALLALAAPAAAAEIVYPSFMWQEPNNAPFLNLLKKTFEQENAGVAVKDVFVPQATFWDKQFTDVTAGNPADIVTLYDPDLKTYVENNLLEPLDAYYAAAGIDTKKLVPSIALARKDGKTYAVPMQINARALFYNDRIFKDAGLQPPKSFDEFQAAIRKLKKPEVQQFGYATVSKPGNTGVFYIEVMPIIVGFNGVGFFRNGKPIASAPETVAGLQFIKTAYDEQLIPRGMEIPQYRQLFAAGKVGMYVSGSFFAGLVANTNKPTFEHLKAMAAPFPSGKTIAITVFLAVPKGSKNKELAAKFLMRMLQDDMQVAFLTSGKSHPGLVGKIPASFIQENPWFKPFEQVTLSARSYAPEGAEQYGAEIVKVIVGHLEAMLFNGVSAAETGKNLQQALEDLIAAKKNS